MTWVLVLILVSSTISVDTQVLGAYNTMSECFYARQDRLVDLEAWEGIPPVNTQLVCVRTDTK